MPPRDQNPTSLPAGFFLTDDKRTPDLVGAIARLPQGFGVIFRHYDSPERGALAEKIARVCRARGLLLLVAGDPALARNVGAGGLHLPEWLARRGRPRGMSAHWLLTAAVHSPAALKRAADIGADAALAGPVFPTASHPGDDALGPHRFARLLELARLPVYALGGINRNTRRKLPTENLAGVAGIGEFL